MTLPFLVHSGVSASRCSNFNPLLIFRRAARLALSLSALVLALASPLFAQVNVLTQHYDNSRTGANTSETVLTPANVASTNFGKLFANPVDGRIYAQPLYVQGLAIPGKGTHNVVFVATEHDSVYAFDADTAGAPLWQITLLDSAHGAPAGATTVPNGDVSSTDIVPEIGITGTPVIDLSTNTLYVVGKTKEGTTYVQRLHALDITTGAEKFAGPVALSATVSGTGNGSLNSVLAWDPKWENNRPGLLLLNGIVYIGYASHGDNGPWHGWILAYNATTLAQRAVYCPTPNGTGGGIWMSGDGLAADVIDPVNAPFGRMFIPTGNGSFNATTPYNNTMSFSDDHVRLDLTTPISAPVTGSQNPASFPLQLPVIDSFTPSNQATLNSQDKDVASGGILLLPDQPGAHPHLLIQVGKEGKIYVINRDNMGGFNSATDNALQEVTAVNGHWASPAYWNGNVYFGGSSDNIKLIPITNGVLASTWTSRSPTGYPFPGASPSISANGTTNGIAWAVDTSAYSSSGNAILHAYDATNLASQLFTSSAISSNTAGIATKFVFPIVANGKVYLGTANELDVYGLGGPATPTATPLISPSSQSFTGTLSVTITDSTAGSSIFYTTDGSTPTTASTPYTGAISVTSSQTIKAIATATGFTQSPVASQTYTLQNQAVAPTFTPAGGTYASTQSVSLSSSTTGAKIYFTTDGTTPSPGVGTTQLYSAPISVAVSETINAIATATNFTNSPVASASYTIASSGTGSNFVNGFASSTAVMTFNGSTGLADTRLQLTDGGLNEAGSAWYNTALNIQGFTSDFSFQLANPSGEGITFTIQNAGLTALGPTGGGLGFGPNAPGNPPGIPTSVAVKFDLVDNAGEGANSTGLYTNGASPTTPAIDLTPSGINLHSGDTFNIHMVYDGTTLTMTITDGVTNATFTTSWTINIPQTVGGNLAYVGFTGGTSSLTSSQKIETWTFTSRPPALPAAAAPTFSLAAGTYLNAQSVTLSDATSGATIFYTLNGTTPGTSVGGSTFQYSTAISVSSSETIKAIATAPNFSTSPVASAAYVIETQAAAPTFSPAPGTYVAAQNVTLASTSSGALIFYTLDGTTPNTSVGGSTFQYTSPISVSATTTIKAIATASGFFASNVSSGTYTINLNGSGSINFGSGFTTGSMILNGQPTISGTRLRVMDGNFNEHSAAWFGTLTNASAFTNDFSFQLTGGTSPTGDGFMFVIQNSGTTALGPVGGGLGYGPDNPSKTDPSSILKSVGIKFDLYSNNGEGINSTGLYLNGASPTTPAVSLPSTINLHSTDTFNVHMVYDGATLTMTITDAVTAASFTTSWTVNIPAALGSSNGYMGFTGGSGGFAVIADVISWTYSASGTTAQTAPPTFSPVGGTYTTTQSVALSDTTTGASIFYTLDGTTPNTTAGGSTFQYSTPISISSNTTITAVAIASGFSKSATASAAYVIQTPAAPPTFSPAAGTYASAQNVAISDTTAGATIFYTLDGTTPNTSVGGSTLQYSSPISVSSNETITAIATAPGFSKSATSSAAYVINLPAAATPTFSPVAGTYTAVQTVTLSDATAAATIYYTTNGTTPTTASTVYSGPIAVNSTTTINAIATASGFTQSAVGSASYTINLPATATPTFSPVAGTYTTTQSVAISDTTTGAAIYYTTNGTTPTTSSTKYTAPITVSANTTINAIALASGFSQSAVATAAYTITPPAATPTFSPAAGTYTTTQSVTISDTTAGSSIFFTTDGTTPTTASTKYTAPIAVSSNTTLNAIATAPNFTQSAVASAVYTITPPAATPTFTPAPGSYASAQNVAINDATSGATIYFTTNGTAPTTSSTVYSGPIAVGANTTINAIATAPGFTQSAVASGFYAIGSTPSINLTGGFPGAPLGLKGSAALVGSALRVTSGVGQAGAGWYGQPVNITSFTTDFNFQISPGSATLADGIAFVIQNTGLTALGPQGGGLGYGGTTGGIGKSVAVKFDIFNNAGEGADSTGIYTNGAAPTIPAVDMTASGVDPKSTHVMKVHMVYDGTTLTMTITDATTNATFTTSWPINIATTVGASTAYVGFTGGTGGNSAIQDVLSWSFSSNPVKTPITYETVNLPFVSSGPSFAKLYYSGFPDGIGTLLGSSKIGDNVSLTLNVPAAGVYDVMVGEKTTTSRGIFQLSVNGAIVGPVSDEYSNTTGTFATVDLGTVTVTSPGPQTFKFTIAGKNPASTGYVLALDDITLTPQ